MSVVGQEFDGTQNIISDVDLRNLFAQRWGEFEEFLVLTVQRVIGPTPTTIEHLLRKVKEQFDLVQENLINSIKCNFLNQATTSKSRELQLKFLNKISLPVYTGMKIIGEESTSIKVALVDCLTGQVVNFGPESTARFEVVLLEGYDGGYNYNSQNFNSKIVAGKRGKKALLKGLTCLSLKEDIAYIDELSFVHNSTWLKNCELCLGARCVDNFPGITIKAANTESFTIKDRRITLAGKRYPPFLDDKVWRLKKINKKGVFFKRLTEEKIDTVKDFLRLLYTNTQKLQKILRVDATAKTWKYITDHARTCVIDEELYLYSRVVFDVVGQVKGLLRESRYFPTDVLSEKPKKDAQKSVNSSFDHWEDVLPFDAENYVVEDSSHSAESPRPESPNGHNQGDPGLLGTYENNCIEESSWWRDFLPSRDDLIDELCSAPEQVSNNPIYSPDYMFDDFELLLSTNSNPQPESSNVDLQLKRRWIVVLFVLKWFRILRRRTRFPEDHVQKKQRIH